MISPLPDNFATAPMNVNGIMQIKHPIAALKEITRACVEVCVDEICKKYICQVTPPSD